MSLVSQKPVGRTAAPSIHVENLGRRKYASGSKAECMRLGVELERTQGLTSWTVAPLDADKGIWGLFI